MTPQELIAERIRHSTGEVFSTMLGMELPEGEDAIEQGSPEVNDGVMALIGLAGAWVGTGCLCCSPALACRLCSSMLMTETTAINEDVLDAVAELTNMIIGSVKNDLESKFGPLGLSIPTVVYGRNFHTRHVGSTEWTVVRFPWGEDYLSIKLFLVPAEKAAHGLPHTHTCTLNI